MIPKYFRVFLEENSQTRHTFFRTSWANELVFERKTKLLGTFRSKTFELRFAILRTPLKQAGCEYARCTLQDNALQDLRMLHTKSQISKRARSPPRPVQRFFAFSARQRGKKRKQKSIDQLREKRERQRWTRGYYWPHRPASPQAVRTLILIILERYGSKRVPMGAQP